MSLQYIDSYICITANKSIYRKKSKFQSLFYTNSQSTLHANLGKKWVIKCKTAQYRGTFKFGSN